MEATSDNPFESPAVKTSRRCPDRYPKLLLLAQACGVTMAAWILVESYTFPRPGVPWPHILFWYGVVTLAATAMIAIPNKYTSLFPFVYFQLVGFVSLFSWINALSFPPHEEVFFFLSTTLLCMVVIITIVQKSSEVYYAWHH